MSNDNVSTPFDGVLLFIRIGLIVSCLGLLHSCFSLISSAPAPAPEEKRFENGPCSTKGGLILQGYGSFVACIGEKA